MLKIYRISRNVEYIQKLVKFVIYMYVYIYIYIYILKHNKLTKCFMPFAHLECRRCRHRGFSLSLSLLRRSLPRLRVCVGSADH